VNFRREAPLYFPARPRPTSSEAKEGLQSKKFFVIPDLIRNPET
jgi:hypothetical protein